MSTYLKIIALFLILLLALLSCGNEKPDVIVTAHRGASGLAPENTMSAVIKAMAAVRLFPIQFFSQ